MLSRFAVLLLCCGFMLSLARPIYAADRSEAFADWLSSVMHEMEDRQLREELSRLKYADLAFDQLIGQASEIVSRHNDNFNLPIGEGSASRQVYQVLLTEWNQYQTGNTMSSVPLPNRVKPHFTVTVDHSLSGDSQPARMDALSPAPEPDWTHARSAARLSLPAPVPMADGVAIGAP